jgi:cyclophilin family peptidyl-prolyl cis-trans isomerase
MKTIAILAALLVVGGWWLTNASKAQEEPAATEEAQVEEEAFVPEGYSLTPYLADAPQQQFEAPEEVLEPGTDYQAVIETSKGRIIAELFQDETPVTVNNFVFLTRHRYYDGVVFHRVLEDFMAQTGDPTGTGRGGPGYTFEDEIVPELSHDGPGVLSMANAGPDTNGSQFFITFAATPWLDGAHTVFGEVIEGLDVLDELQRIDPQQPEAFLPLTGTLDELNEQGITLEGAQEASLEGYLTERLGAVPSIGESFALDGYNATVGQNRATGETVVGFWPQPDRIERLYIVERSQE